MSLNLRFTWDPHKAVVNQRKHKVSFDEAREIFSDSYARITFDADHDEDEDRWHIIGRSSRNRTLFVAFCEREHHDGEIVYRIISARRAEGEEIKEYEDGV
jgi:uncharacterized protein